MLKQKWSISSTKVDHAGYIRKALPANRVKFNQREGRCLKGYRQIKGEGRPCAGIYFRNMTELQTDYIDRYVGIQAKIHQVSQFEESSALSTTYFGKVNMSRENAFRT